MRKSTKFSHKIDSIENRDRTLYLINDHYNTFEHVINCLVALCEHDELQAEQCALLTHYKGSCEIATGKTEDIIALQEDLAIYGLDIELL